jgi:hypothetical protein
MDRRGESWYDGPAVGVLLPLATDRFSGVSLGERNNGLELWRRRGGVVVGERRGGERGGEGGGGDASEKRSAKADMLESERGLSPSLRAEDVVSLLCLV